MNVEQLIAALKTQPLGDEVTVLYRDSGLGVCGLIATEVGQRNGDVAIATREAEDLLEKQSLPPSRPSLSGGTHDAQLVHEHAFRPGDVVWVTCDSGLRSLGMVTHVASDGDVTDCVVQVEHPTGGKVFTPQVFKSWCELELASHLEAYSFCTDILDDHARRLENRANDLQTQAVAVKREANTLFDRRRQGQAMNAILELIAKNPWGDDV